MKKNDKIALKQKAGQAAALLKNLANTSRLLILCELHSEERSVGDLVRSTGASQPHVSQLLARFREEGLVTSERRGKEVFYMLKRSCVSEIIEALWKEFCKDQRRKA